MSNSYERTRGRGQDAGRKGYIQEGDIVSNFRENTALCVVAIRFPRKRLLKRESLRKVQVKRWETVERVGSGRSRRGEVMY